MRLFPGFVEKCSACLGFLACNRPLRPNQHCMLVQHSQVSIAGICTASALWFGAMSSPAASSDDPSGSGMDQDPPVDPPAAGADAAASPAFFRGWDDPAIARVPEQRHPERRPWMLPELGFWITTPKATSAKVAKAYSLPPSFGGEYLRTLEPSTNHGPITAVYWDSNFVAVEIHSQWINVASSWGRICSYYDPHDRRW